MHTLLYRVSIFISMGSSSQGQMLGNPQNQSWSRTIITVILIKVLHCDPLIFSQCWLHCSAVTTSITKLQPVINLHMVYMFPNQHTVNPNPKITPTRTGKPLPLSNMNIFLPHTSLWYGMMMMMLFPASDHTDVCLDAHPLFVCIFRDTLWPTLFCFCLKLKLKVFIKYDTNITHTLPRSHTYFCSRSLWENGNNLTFSAVFTSIIIFTSVIIK